MTAATQPATRPRCAAVVPAVRVGPYGLERIQCHQWRGLRRIGDLWACAKHRGQVEGLSRRAAG